MASFLGAQEDRAFAQDNARRLAEILSWPLDELDPVPPLDADAGAALVLRIGIKALLDGKLGREAARDRDRQRILAQLERDLRPQ